MKNAFKTKREKTGEINAQVESSISGIRVTRAYAASNYEIEKFKVSNENFKNARAVAYKQMGIFGSGMNFFTDFLYLVIILASGLLLAFGKITNDSLTAAVLYVAMIISPIRTLIAIFEQIQSGLTGFARFQEIMKEETEKECRNMDKSMGRYRITGKDTAERLKEDRACSKALKYSILRKDSFMNKKITEEGNEGNYI